MANHAEIKQQMLEKRLKKDLIQLIQDNGKGNHTFLVDIGKTEMEVVRVTVSTANVALA